MLNAHYTALRAVTVRRAFSLLFKRDATARPVAEVVSFEDGQYVSYDFEDWAELSAFRQEVEPFEYDWIRTVRRVLAVPRIIRVLTYSRTPRRELKFSRQNVFARDGHTCQYCGRHLNTVELSLDHIVPRSRGGGATWDNIVCACRSCNVRKGGRTPKEARLRLIRPPTKPHYRSVITVELSDRRYSSWQHFLNTYRFGELAG